MRYGVNIQAEVTEKKKMVHLIDWANPMENDFQIAEEVTIQGASDRRPIWSCMLMVLLLL